MANPTGIIKVRPQFGFHNDGKLWPDTTKKPANCARQVIRCVDMRNFAVKQGLHPRRTCGCHGCYENRVRRVAIQQGTHQRLGRLHFSNRDGMYPDDMLAKGRCYGTKTLRPATPVVRDSQSPPRQANKDKRRQQVKQQGIEFSQW